MSGPTQVRNQDCHCRALGAQPALERAIACESRLSKAALYTEEMAAQSQAGWLGGSRNPKPIDKVVGGLKFYIKRLTRRRR